MTTVRVKMNTPAAFQLRDAQGKPAGFSAVSKGDEVDMPVEDAKSFAKAGYATILEQKTAK
jgi:hypothetical protein